MKAFLVYFVALLIRCSPCMAVLLTQLCQGSTYAANSTFQSNLKLLLGSLSYPNGAFFMNTIGSNTADPVYGLVLCRGDTSETDCYACVRNATQSVAQGCLYHRQATSWYENCQVRYSDKKFFSLVNNSDAQLLDIKKNASDPKTFMKFAKELMEEISSRAAYDSSLLMFATGIFFNTIDIPSIYGLVQCTRDLLAYGCSDCLQQILGYFWNSYGGVEGAMILGKSCNFRYEVYPFYEGKPVVTLGLPSLAPGPALANREGSKHNNIILFIVIPLAFVLVVLISIHSWKKRSAKHNIPGTSEQEEISTVESILFDLSLIKAATSDFSDANKLGQGGFGAVYKGILPNAEEIAVKRLSTSSKQGLGELKNELLLVAKLQHKNLVRLRGACLQEEEKLLVYEYVPNRSLDTILFDPAKSHQLNWETRFKIIGGIARGLLYLHEESRMKVIHRDLKASNVLLDTDMNPKISDFGLARLFEGDESQCTASRVVGTVGYMAPEYARIGRFSTKLDVFSFGILVLEIVTGRKNNSFHESEDAHDLLTYTWKHWREEKISEIIDPSLDGNFPRNEVLKCIRVGLLCAQEAASRRPAMSAVVLMLQSPSVELPAPSDPKLIYEPHGSVNEVTISELDPR